EAEADRIENRLDEIKTVQKKYGGSAEAVSDYLTAAKKELEALTNSVQRLEEIGRELSSLNDSVYTVCTDLDKARKEVAAGFTERVTKELKTLNISSARFEVQFDSFGRNDADKANENGLGGLRFLFSANAGEPLKELGKIISGGEMSRFMLAVKTQSNLNEIGTYIFDEIDAGISGKTARVVGEKFCKIARNTQVIAVSHLAQIAAFADCEYLIEKREKNGATRTTVRAVTGEERVTEISRLAGGDTESEIALQHARELLKSAQNYKNSL
ncbi:MAG: DNA repair protein RecN, partial [Candidatus Gallimonas sp.]